MRGYIVCPGFFKKGFFKKRFFFFYTVRNGRKRKRNLGLSEGAFSRNGGATQSYITDRFQFLGCRSCFQPCCGCHDACFHLAFSLQCQQENTQITVQNGEEKQKQPNNSNHMLNPGTMKGKLSVACFSILNIIFHC